jgi:indole-3-glycerol phosphate synthase
MSLLREIVEGKRRDLRGLRRDRPWAVLEAEALYAAPRRSLAEALRRGDGPIRFLTEIKRASPSAGWIRRDGDALAVGRRYAECGAAGLSLVTEERYFHGRPEDLPRLRELGLPLLMKDFIIDPYQVALARAGGADAILLIAALEDGPMLAEARAAARELEIEVLLEVHDERECETAHALEPELAGVNHRNLATFEIRPEVSERLLPRLPAEARRIAESGIRARADVRRLEVLGYDGVLVGEALMRAEDPGRELLVLRGEGEGEER